MGDIIHKIEGGAAVEHTCCFFGHKDTPETIKGNLFAAIEQLIVEHGVETFYVGNQGSFDFYEHNSQGSGNRGYGGVDL